jgi:hypothetical protein
MAPDCDLHIVIFRQMAGWIILHYYALSRKTKGLVYYDLLHLSQTGFISLVRPDKCGFQSRILVSVL